MKKFTAQFSAVIMGLMLISPMLHALTEQEFVNSSPSVRQETINGLRNAMFEFIFGYGEWFYGDPITTKHCVAFVESNNMFGYGGIYRFPPSINGFYLSPKKENETVNWNTLKITYDINVPESKFKFGTCPDNLDVVGLDVLYWELPTTERNYLDGLMNRFYQSVKDGDGVIIDGLGIIGYTKQIVGGQTVGGSALLKGVTVQEAIDLGFVPPQ